MRMKRQSLAFLALLIGILLIIFWLPANRALLSEGEIRAALDIGSGTTNLKIAKVDPKTGKIVVSLFEQSIPVPYQVHLEQSKNQTFDSEVMQQGILAIKSLKEVASSYQAQKVVAVATAAFRQAANGDAFAREIEKQAGVKVRVINQDEEGILAFRAALALSSIQPQFAVVWDIGGGSMQLTTLSNEGTYLIEKGKTASIPFKNYVIQQIQHKDLKSTISPNPISAQEMKDAVGYAAKLAKETTAPFIKEKLTAAKVHVLAVGNLFNYGIKPLVDNQVVKQKALEKAAFKLADKTDADLSGGPLVDVRVTNPLLVLGYMEGLNLSQVDIMKANNADGALTYPPYWE